MTAVNIEKEIEKHFFPDPIPSYGPPKFIIFTGCVGSGKTTERRKHFSQSYVTVDAGEIFCSLTKGGHGAFGKDYFYEMNTIGFRVLERAVTEKRNIVMEIVGAEPEILKGFDDIISSFGYKVDFQAVNCEPAEAYERHVNAGINDPSYISAHHTEPYHQKWVADLWDKMTGQKEDDARQNN
ncbi:MAG: hypothetical protein ABH891_04645 [Candidatus Omnitrophota bacterium]